MCVAERSERGANPCVSTAGERQILRSGKKGLSVARIFFVYAKMPIYPNIFLYCLELEDVQ